MTEDSHFQLCLFCEGYNPLVPAGQFGLCANEESPDFQRVKESSDFCKCFKESKEC